MCTADHIHLLVKDCYREMYTFCDIVSPNRGFEMSRNIGKIENFDLFIFQIPQNTRHYARYLWMCHVFPIDIYQTCSTVWIVSRLSSVVVNSLTELALDLVNRWKYACVVCTYVNIVAILPVCFLRNFRIPSKLNYHNVNAMVEERRASMANQTCGRKSSSNSNMHNINIYT